MEGKNKAGKLEKIGNKIKENNEIISKNRTKINKRRNTIILLTFGVVAITMIEIVTSIDPMTTDYLSYSLLSALLTATEAEIGFAILEKDTNKMLEASVKPYEAENEKLHQEKKALQEPKAKEAPKEPASVLSVELEITQHPQNSLEKPKVLVKRIGETHESRK